MAKFKAGERVRVVMPNELVKVGATGTVTENSSVPYVRWDLVDMLTEKSIAARSYQEDGLIPIDQEFIELITESSSPTPEMGPVEGTMEHWRWEKSAAVLAAMASDPSRNGSHETYAEDAVKFVDCLIAELKKGGNP